MYTDYIKAKLDERTLLEMLAEEGAELSKAALKKIRAQGLSDNVTPVSADDAQAGLSEEAWDVMTVLYLLGYDFSRVDIERYWKFKRWADRLGEGNATGYTCGATKTECTFCQPGPCGSRRATEE